MFITHRRCVAAFCLFAAHKRHAVTVVASTLQHRAWWHSVRRSTSFVACCDGRRPSSRAGPQVVGRVEAFEGKRVTVRSEFGEYVYDH